MSDIEGKAALRMWAPVDDGTGVTTGEPIVDVACCEASPLPFAPPSTLSGPGTARSKKLTLAR